MIKITDCAGWLHYLSVSGMYEFAQKPSYIISALQFYGVQAVQLGHRCIGSYANEMSNV